ncbi:MAG: purine-binding chemotaxis protein CheW [Thermoanaerobaculia bacterium]|jgi:purine-binding chemotaxis protein CheW|nr:purine-binding chemotaxis protein CheW [Thermoanaerobaculia bacterium]
MVDLVKIRKKAKRGLGVGSGESEPTPAANAVIVSAPEIAVAPQPEPVADAAPTPTPHPPLPTPASNKLDQFKATAGQRREDFFQREDETTTAEQVELLTFIIAGEQYAVSIEHLVEIITPRAATQVPNADPTIVGIISLRGTMVTVIDVRRKLRHPPAAGGNDARVIVVERAGEVLGFEVDRVLRVLKVDSAAVEPHPVVHSSELTEAVRGVFRHANALTILLDLDKLLA